MELAHKAARLVHGPLPLSLPPAVIVADSEAQRALSCRWRSSTSCLTPVPAAALRPRLTLSQGTRSPASLSREDRSSARSRRAVAPIMLELRHRNAADGCTAWHTGIVTGVGWSGVAGGTVAAVRGRAGTLDGWGGARDDPQVRAEEERQGPG
ncbi:MAG: hypothetical protein WDW38_009685 [Sanguina aurantia]